MALRLNWRGSGPLGLLPLFTALTLWVLWYFSLPLPLFDVPQGLLILDRNGIPLDMRIAADEQWRIPLDGPVPDRYKTALLHFEDRRFYDHLGVDLPAIARALWLNIREGEVVSGGSTITMQVARLSLSQSQRSLLQKIIEASLALRIETNFSKEEILRLYADNAPFGGNIVGLGAASWLYFGRSPEDLSWAEAALLAILPNNPSHLRIERNRPALLERRNQLLRSMAQAGLVEERSVMAALDEPLPQGIQRPSVTVPGLVNRAISQGRGSGVVHTTIDETVQSRIATIMTGHGRALYNSKVNNLAVLVVDLVDNEVLAYLGNTPLEDQGIPGSQVDIITAPRSTGSLLKPFLYGAMQDSGEMLPTELLVDIPLRYGSYSPQNHTKTFLGAIPADQALARSLNVPFVAALADFGVPRFKTLLEDLGLSTLTRAADDYGLPLILGGAEGTMWELATAFASLTRLSQQLVPRSRAIEAPALFDPPIQRGSRSSPISAPAWYLSLMAMAELERPGLDANWRRFVGEEAIAWKTGTSQGFRDAWAIGMGPQYLVAVWAGNAEGPGTPDLGGTFTAAPLMFDAFRIVGPQGNFDQPPGLETIDVSPESGFIPHPADPLEPVPQLATAAAERSARISPYHRFVNDENARPRLRFVLPPTMGWYYSRWQLSYQALDPGRTAPIPMALTNPQPGAIFLIPTDYGQVQQSIVFEAQHNDPTALIHWHLDGEYLGSSRGIHSMEANPRAGEHQLILIDQGGYRIELSFEVRG